MAWSKTLFDQFFESDIVSIRNALHILINATNDLDSRSYLAEEIANIYARALRSHGGSNEGYSLEISQLRFVNGSVALYAEWAIDTFNRLFYSDLKQLTAMHSLEDEKANDNHRFREESVVGEEDSRKIIPQHIERFNRTDPLHLQFTTHAAKLLCACFGREITTDQVISILSSTASRDVEHIPLGNPATLSAILTSWIRSNSDAHDKLLTRQHLLDLISKTIGRLYPTRFEKVVS